MRPRAYAQNTRAVYVITFVVITGSYMTIFIECNQRLTSPLSACLTHTIGSMPNKGGVTALYTMTVYNRA